MCLMLRASEPRSNIRSMAFKKDFSPPLSQLTSRHWSVSE
jgi:hypothetical protein